MGILRKHFEKVNFKVIEEIYKKSRLKRALQFGIGCLIVAIAYNLFLAPNNLVAGGVSGLAIILKKLFNFDDFYVILIGDVLLLGASYLLLGKEKTRGSVIGSLLFPVFIKLTSNITNIITIDTSPLLLSSIFGGVLFGIGAGMIFKAGYTTGGTDILNQIVAKYFKLGVGTSMLYTDGLIILFSSFIFGATKLMYSVIILYIISVMSDRIILGISDSKAFYIVTAEEEAIKEYILKYLNHGVTIFNAKGGLAKEKHNVLMCVLPTKDYYKLKEGIAQIDPEAFFVVTDAYEVFGGE